MFVCVCVYVYIYIYIYIYIYNMQWCEKVFAPFLFFLFCLFVTLERFRSSKKSILHKDNPSTYKMQFWNNDLICIRKKKPSKPAWQSVVDKVHRSSTWVKVQIRIIKYYSSKSKSTAFSILLEWKYKSTTFFMYLSKKVLIDRFILQIYFI